MAEYIWIDGMNGVRSKTKVRKSLLPPRHPQPQRTVSRPLYQRRFLGGVNKALLSDERTTR